MKYITLIISLLITLSSSAQSATPRMMFGCIIPFRAKKMVYRGLVGE